MNKLILFVLFLFSLFPLFGIANYFQVPLNDGGWGPVANQNGCYEVFVGQDNSTCFVYPFARYINPIYPSPPNPSGVCCPSSTGIELNFLQYVNICPIASFQWIINGSHTVVSGSYTSRPLVIDISGTANGAGACNSVGSCFDILLQVNFANGTTATYRVLAGMGCC